MMMLNEIAKVIERADNIAVFPHVSADGDALGSCIALGLALRKKGKKVKIYLEDEIPAVYGFLTGKDITEVYTGKTERFDLGIAVDTGDYDRLGSRADSFKDATITVNIDHHFTNSEFAFHNYVQPDAAASGEIIFNLVKLMGLEIDIDMAVCLYVAISTDTGGFRYSNTTGTTHSIASELLNKGINVSEISQSIFDTTSLAKVKLMGEAINSLEIYENGKIAFITLTDEMMSRSGANDEDCDGIVNIGRNIRGVEAAALLRQRGNGEIKANLRSNKFVDVSAIAGLYNGGGHKRAAGFTTLKSLEETKKLLLQDIKEAL